MMMGRKVMNMRVKSENKTVKNFRYKMGYVSLQLKKQYFLIAGGLATSL